MINDVLATCARLRRRGRFAAQLTVATVDGSGNGLNDRFFFVRFLICVKLVLAEVAGTSRCVTHAAHFAVSIDRVAPLVAAVHAVVNARRAAGSSDGLAAIPASGITIGVLTTRKQVLFVVVYLRGGG